MSFSVVGAWTRALRRLDFPMELVVGDYGRYRVGKNPLAGKTRPLPSDAYFGVESHSVILIIGECGVDPAGISVVDDIFERQDSDGSFRPGRALSSPEVDELTEGAVRVGAALSFVAGIGLSVRPTAGTGFTNAFLPESHQEDRRLQELGNEHVRLPLAPITGVEVFDDRPVGAELIRDLAGRGPVRVYADVLQLTTPVSQFRELWRTLELAFQARGRKLVDLLARFPPAQALEFDREELEGFRTLRGRISHASSRLGTRDVSRFEAEVLARIGRLWSLVDRVILTKKDASQSLDVDELRPLAAFIGPDGRTRVEFDVDDEEHVAALHANLRFLHP